VSFGAQVKHPRLLVPSRDLSTSAALDAREVDEHAPVLHTRDTNTLAEFRKCSRE
jgi:hypothetical protein